MASLQATRAKIEQDRDRLIAQARDLEKTLDIIEMYESAAGRNGQTRLRAAAETAPDVADDVTAPPAAGKRRKSHRRKMTAAERKAVGARMRKYWASKRAASRKSGRGASASANV